jgi:heavy metal sensor kinase
MQYSIRNRLLTAYGLILALFMLLFGVALFWGLDRSFDERLQSELESVVYDIKHDLLTGRLKTPALLDPQEEYAVSPVYVEMWERDVNGSQPMLFSTNMTDHRLPLLDVHGERFELDSLPSFSKAGKTALLAEPVEVDQKHYVIVAATPADKFDDVISDFIWLFALFGSLLYLLAFFLGWRMISRVLSPMRSITETAASISQSDLSKRVPLPGVRDEFHALAQTFNAMLERIEKAFEQTKRFNANVSHELKTPLTIIRGEAEVALRNVRDSGTYESVLHSILEESAAVQQIIDGMLLLSRSDTASLQSIMVTVDLDDLLRWVMDKLRPAAEAKGISMCLVHMDSARITGEPQLLKEALHNLVDNAVKYTHESGRIAVTMHTIADAVEIRISDNGIGMDETALSKVYEPFWREDTAHSKTLPGHGLGLSIVQWVVQAHRGTIGIESKKEEGTTCVLRFLTSEPLPMRIRDENG